MASKVLVLLILTGVIPSLVYPTSSQDGSSRTRQSHGSFSGPFCYECNAVLYPSECRHVTLCDTGESCYTERFNDSTNTEYYRLGCRPTKECNYVSETHSCQACCNTSHCNSILCDPQAANHILCYKCDEMIHPKFCDILVPCAQHEEKCYIEKVVTDTYAVRYNAGCMRNVVCNGIAKHWGVEKRSQHYPWDRVKRNDVLANICAECCEGEKCNGIDCVIE